MPFIVGFVMSAMAKENAISPLRPKTVPFKDPAITDVVTRILHVDLCLSALSRPHLFLKDWFVSSFILGVEV